MDLEGTETVPVGAWEIHKKFPHRCAKQDFAPLGVTQPTLKLLFEFCLCTRVSKNVKVHFSQVEGLWPCIPVVLFWGEGGLQSTGSYGRGEENHP